MKLENQVCSLELAKKLKELGVKQESLFYWCEYKDQFVIPIKTKPYVIFGNRKWKKELLISAFTVAELGEMLPHRIPNHQKVNPYSFIDVDFYKNPSGFYQGWINNSRVTSCVIMSDTEANARAKMLIYLIENNLLVPPTIKK